MQTKKPKLANAKEIVFANKDDIHGDFLKTSFGISEIENDPYYFMVGKSNVNPLSENRICFYRFKSDIDDLKQPLFFLESKENIDTLKNTVANTINHFTGKDKITVNDLKQHLQEQMNIDIDTKHYGEWHDNTFAMRYLNNREYQFKLLNDDKGCTQIHFREAKAGPYGKTLPSRGIYTDNQHFFNTATLKTHISSYIRMKEAGEWDSTFALYMSHKEQEAQKHTGLNDDHKIQPAPAAAARSEAALSKREQPVSKQEIQNTTPDAGYIQPMNLLKYDQFKDTRFANVLKTTGNITTLTDYGQLEINGKYETLRKLLYTNKNSKQRYVLERVRAKENDGQTGFITDVWHFENDFNLTSAKNFIKQYETKVLCRNNNHVKEKKKTKNAAL
jgi:hypothetical protein